MIKIPLFPLGVVLLPGMPMPLHIFEERYKLMVSECLDADKTFGIVYFDGKVIHSTGCLARIVEVVKNYDDGRMDILTIGEHRFVIQELVEEKPYTEARISFFDDIVFRSEEKLNDLIENAEGLLNHLSSTGRLTGSIKELIGLDVKTLSFWIASISEFTYEEQQHFLEIKSSNERLKRAINALSKIVERQQLTEEIHRIIGGNGHHPTRMLKRSEA